MTFNEKINVNYNKFPKIYNLKTRKNSLNRFV